MRRTLPAVRFGYAVLLATAIAATGLAFYSGGISRGTAMAVLSVGALCPIGLWAYRIGRTIPLVAILASQDLLWYGLPLGAGHQSLNLYTSDEVLNLAIPFAVYFTALTCSWWVMVRQPSHSLKSVRMLNVVDRGGRQSIVISCLAILAGCFLIDLSFLLGWIYPLLAKLPMGFTNIIRTCTAAGVAGATLLLAHEFGRGRLRSSRLWISVSLLLAILLTQIASILLSSCVSLIASLLLGLYLGSRKIPWKTATVMILILAFFNLAKFEMREKYWGTLGGRDTLSLSEMPQYFGEWVSRSFRILADDVTSEGKQSSKGQTLVERISNVQMLLYVNKRIDTVGDPLLEGRTYAVVPMTLMPRMFWANKPRAHIGQEILNVHFGRQTRAETFKTYIAWGLLPESVGNFGTLCGPLVLGVFLGTVLGWIESRTSGLPLFSLSSIMTGFLAISLMSASGMVASVYLSSISQMFLVLLIATAPYVKKVDVVKIRRPVRLEDRHRKQPALHRGSFKTL